MINTSFTTPINSKDILTSRGIINIMDIIEKATIFAKIEYEKNDQLHQWTHVNDVMKRALEIANKLDCVDYELLKLGVIFHDIDYNSEKTYKENYIKHVENSIKKAEKFLKNYNYPHDKIIKIQQILLDHSTPHRLRYGDSKIKEGQILYDADKSIFLITPEKYDKYFSKLYFDETRNLIKKPHN